MPVFEYLVRTRYELDGFPLVIDMNDQARVYQPTGWSCQPIEGWGDFRFRTGDTEISFSAEPPGIQVVVEGSMPRDEADHLLEVVSTQLTTHTGRATVVVPLT
jgi:hypothetical protein